MVACLIKLKFTEKDFLSYVYHAEVVRCAQLERYTQNFSLFPSPTIIILASAALVDPRWRLYTFSSAN